MCGKGSPACVEGESCMYGRGVLRVWKESPACVKREVLHVWKGSPACVKGESCMCGREVCMAAIFSGWAIPLFRERGEGNIIWTSQTTTQPQKQREKGMKTCVLQPWLQTAGRYFYVHVFTFEYA